MGRPLRIEFPGAYYHVTSRGNEQKNIFKSKKDREQFLAYLESAVFRYGAMIHAWCLITNHYHLLVETPRGNLSQIMRHINGAYTNYFNGKRKRSGHLFQGRYTAILVEAEEYLLELSRYIHLNPVKAGIVTRPEDYPWSSFLEYVGRRQQAEWLTTRFVLQHFEGERGRYRHFVEEVLGETYQSPLEKTIAATILGSEEFVTKITKSHLARKQKDRNLSAVRQLVKPMHLENITAAVKNAWDDELLARKAGIYLAHRYSGARLKELGEYFGMGESGVSQASRRFAAFMEKDVQVRNKVREIQEKLRLS